MTRRLPILFLSLLATALVGACADDDDAGKSSSLQEGNYATEMRLTEVNCTISLGDPEIKSRLTVSRRDGKVYFNGPFLLDPQMSHEMGWNAAGVMEYRSQSEGRTYVLTANAEGSGLYGEFSLEFPGCIARGEWTATRR